MEHRKTSLPPSPGDASLLEVFERWKALSLAIEAAGQDDDEGEGPALVAERDVAEELILHTPVTTAAGMLVKQRMALDHMPVPKWASLALYAGDDATLFARRSVLDVDAKLIVDGIGFLAAQVSA